MSKRYVLEIDLYAFADDEADLSRKAKLIEAAINALDFASDADVKPIAYESGKGIKSFFPKQIKINKNLKNGKDN